jgi:hypothetical protein
MALNLAVKPANLTFRWTLRKPSCKLCREKLIAILASWSNKKENISAFKILWRTSRNNTKKRRTNWTSSNGKTVRRKMSCFRQKLKIYKRTSTRPYLPSMTLLLITTNSRMISICYVVRRKTLRRCLDLWRNKLANMNRNLNKNLRWSK